MIARRRLKAEAQTLGIPVTKVIRDDGIFMLNPVDLDVLRDQGGGEAHPELINQSVHQRRALMSSWSMFRMRKTRPHCLSSAIHSRRSSNGPTCQPGVRPMGGAVV